MKKSLITLCLTASLALAGVATSLQASAQSEASAALSLMPVASVVGGAMLTVVAVEASAEATVYLLERVSDGARASIRVSGRAARGVSTVAGAAVLVSVVATGVVLSAAGEVLAFVPNDMGRALLHNEKLS